VPSLRNGVAQVVGEAATNDVRSEVQDGEEPKGEVVTTQSKVKRISRQVLSDLVRQKMKDLLEADHFPSIDVHRLHLYAQILNLVDESDGPAVMSFTCGCGE